MEWTERSICKIKNEVHSHKELWRSSSWATRRSIKTSPIRSSPRCFSIQSNELTFDLVRFAFGIFRPTAIGNNRTLSIPFRQINYCWYHRSSSDCRPVLFHRKTNVSHCNISYGNTLFWTCVIKQKFSATPFRRPKRFVFILVQT